MKTRFSYTMSISNKRTILCVHCVSMPMPVTTEQRVYGIFLTRRGRCRPWQPRNHGSRERTGSWEKCTWRHNSSTMRYAPTSEVLDWCTDHDPPTAETVQILVDLGMAHNLHGNSHGAKWAFELAISMDQTLVERLIRKSHERLDSWWAR